MIYNCLGLRKVNQDCTCEIHIIVAKRGPVRISKIPGPLLKQYEKGRRNNYNVATIIWNSQVTKPSSNTPQELLLLRVHVFRLASSRLITDAARVKINPDFAECPSLSWKMKLSLLKTIKKKNTKTRFRGARYLQQLSSARAWTVQSESYLGPPYIFPDLCRTLEN